MTADPETLAEWRAKVAGWQADPKARKATVRQIRQTARSDKTMSARCRSGAHVGCGGRSGWHGKAGLRDCTCPCHRRLP